MLHRLILKVTKFQLPPPTHLSTVVKNILGGHHAPPCRLGLNVHFLNNDSKRLEFDPTSAPIIWVFTQISTQKSGSYPISVKNLGPAQSSIPKR